ncbi:unnamed protein product [Cylindrotheca closterium]|uniref:Uncharacterized protein n=1 Tax=Cylindrotheca closterium TaxID=2856 RepID=A0AAD2FCL3_9STRA|nr:unnamed protein product [Cylindrotheca closterium]
MKGSLGDRKRYDDDSSVSSDEDLEHKGGECRRQEKVYDNSSSVSSDEDHEHKEAVNVGRAMLSMSQMKHLHF